jgi:hypothetical protein
VVAPAAVRRLDAVAVLAQAAVLVALFAGPQLSSPTDALWWIAGSGVVLTVAWQARRLEIANAWAVAAGLGAAGALLVVLGGAP